MTQERRPVGVAAPEEAHPAHRPGRSRAVCLAAWALALAAAAWSSTQVLRRPLPDRLADLHIYRAAVAGALHGASLYAFHSARGAGFTYPPFAGLLLVPLAQLSEPAARLSWTLLTLAAVAAIGLVVTRALPRPWGPTQVIWPLLTALLLASKPVLSNLRFGQVSILLTLVVLIDLLSLDGRPTQGVLTGICAAIKLTPLVFLPYLWLSGRRRAAVLAAGSFTLAGLVGALAFPADSRAFWGDHLFHDTRALPLAETGNQSIYAVLLRAGAQARLLTVLWLSLSVVVAAVGLWRARLAYQSGRPLLGAALAGCVAVLVSPITWTHNQLWILLAAAGIFSANAALDAAFAAALVVPLLIGLPGVSALGPAGRWLASNDRSVLAGLVIFLLPLTLRRPPAIPPDSPSPVPAVAGPARPAS